MNTTDIGSKGESRVANELKRQGYKIIDSNWRNKWCEIDLIASKDKAVFFVEVKFRSRSDWGDGFDAVGRDKLNRMSRAAEAWVTQNKWPGEYELLVAAVDDSSIDVRPTN